jgi:hypothetical protein
MSRIDPEVQRFLEGLAQQFAHALTHSSEVTERLTNGIVNHVLEVATRTIPTEGFFMKEYGATAGCVVVHNHGTNLVTVAAGLSSGVAPREGVGVYNISSGTWETVNLGARGFTIYGTAGDRVSYQVFTRGGLVGGGFLSMDGGTL